MTVIKPAAAPYLAAFDHRSRASEPRWLTAGRTEALRRFGELGFPTRREEAWRFTDLRPLQSAVFTPSDGMSPGAAAPDAWRVAGETYRLVLVNGYFAPELSALEGLPGGTWLASTARTLHERPDLLESDLLDATDRQGGQPFASLNAAFFGDGFVLALEPGMVLEKPVEILHWGDAAGSALHLRNLVRLGTNSRATIIESFAGGGTYWTNAVTRIRLDTGAALRHVKLQDESRAAIHLAQTRIGCEAAARYESFVLTLGARLSRHDSFAALDGASAHCALDGAYLLRGEQEATNATFVDHIAPSGTTKEFFKGVIADRAHGVFLGKIAVRPDAQKTDAHQLNRNLLLSPHAAVDTKPELEILADDVKCSHGATVGDLDEAALFYMQARGIPDAEARHMLIGAFALDAIDRVEDLGLRAHLAAHLERWLAELERGVQ